MKTLILIFIFSATAFSQEFPQLPPNFQYQRETGEQSGKPFFHVMPSDESIAYDAKRGNTFEALGALVQPERDKYALSFMNAKQIFQFSTNKNKTCTITADNEKFEFPKFIQGIKSILGRLKVETVNININKKVFDKIVDSDDVTIRCGVVNYNLDADNIDALRYLANEADADLERRNIKLPFSKSEKR